MKKLTNQEIKVLHQFVQKHYVEYYDVEVELVDHLANGIEKQWEEDNQLPFEQALNIEFKKFGIFGFSDLVSMKTQNITLSYIKILLRELKKFFSWYKILITIALFGVIYISMHYLSQNFAVRDIGDVFIVCVFIFMISWLLYNYIQTKKEAKNENKRWLLNKVKSQFIAFPTIMFFVYFRFFFSIMHQSIFTISLLMLITLLWGFLSISFISPLIDKEKEKIKRRLIT
ncbi:hypothetical protein [Myroides injenensis]|uniref:hypothetical protein n=1 Tax=Myroides injenensis TaxID=1183151 RepID=UPI0004747167|nr:hypothetical protein [Myroides injenensis]